MPSQGRGESGAFLSALLGPPLDYGPWRYSRVAKGKVLTVAFSVYAFIDETGDQKIDNRIFMCGYACQDEVWQSFSSDWGAIIANTGSGPIHGTELLSCKGAFYGWDETRADNLVADLVNIIRSKVPLGVAVGLDMKHYRTFTPAQRNQLGSPLLACMVRIIDVFVGIVDEMRQRGEDVAGINLAFDDSAESVEMLKTWIQLKKVRRTLTDYIKAVSFADDKWFFPLQAADLLGNLTNRYWQPNLLNTSRSRERAERHLRALLTPDATFPFAYRVGFVTAKELDDAHRQHRRLY
jgi:hypothetical protein